MRRVSCNCGGRFHRVRQDKVLSEEFTDCRDVLPHVTARCAGCGRSRKLLREAVPGGKLKIDDFNKLQAKHGWPVPEALFP